VVGPADAGKDSAAKMNFYNLSATVDYIYTSTSSG